MSCMWQMILKNCLIYGAPLFQSLPPNHNLPLTPCKGINLKILSKPNPNSTQSNST